MAPDSSVRPSPVRAALIAAALAGSILLGLAGGVDWAAALTTTGSTSQRVESPALASGFTARPSVPVRSQPDPAAAPIPTASAAPSAPAGATQATYRAPVAAPPPPAYRMRLVSADGTLNTGVSYYSDCTGHTVLSRAYAAIDTCVGGRTYFVGHNPGVFTPLLSMGVGAIITWYDGNGAAHPLRIIAVRQMAHVGVPGLVAGATVQFQTCITPDQTLNRILDAAPA